MTNKEKLEKIADIMDLEVEEIQEDSMLKDFDEWDSVAALSLIVLMDEEFGKTINGSQIRDMITVKDIMNIMEI